MEDPSLRRFRSLFEDQRLELRRLRLEHETLREEVDGLRQCLGDSGTVSDASLQAAVLSKRCHAPPRTANVSCGLRRNEGFRLGDADSSLDARSHECCSTSVDPTRLLGCSASASRLCTRERSSDRLPPSVVSSCERPKKTAWFDGLAAANTPCRAGRAGAIDRAMSSETLRESSQSREAGLCSDIANVAEQDARPEQRSTSSPEPSQHVSALALDPAGAKSNDAQPNAELAAAPAPGPMPALPLRDALNMRPRYDFASQPLPSHEVATEHRDATLAHLGNGSAIGVAASTYPESEVCAPGSSEVEQCPRKCLERQERQERQDLPVEMRPMRDQPTYAEPMASRQFDEASPQRVVVQRPSSPPSSTAKESLLHYEPCSAGRWSSNISFANAQEGSGRRETGHQSWLSVPADGTEPYSSGLFSRAMSVPRVGSRTSVSSSSLTRAGSHSGLGFTSDSTGQPPVAFEFLSQRTQRTLWNHKPPLPFCPFEEESGNSSMNANARGSCFPNFSADNCGLRASPSRWNRGSSLARDPRSASEGASRSNVVGASPTLSCSWESEALVESDLADVRRRVYHASFAAKLADLAPRATRP